LLNPWNRPLCLQV